MLTALLKPGRRVSRWRRVIARRARLRRSPFGYRLGRIRAPSPPLARTGSWRGRGVHTDLRGAGDALVRNDPRLDLEAVRCPALVLQGRATCRCRSPTPLSTPGACGRRFASIADCGHLLIGERPGAAPTRSAAVPRPDGERDVLPGRGPNRSTARSARERLHAECLGGVVAAGEEVDAELAGRVQAGSSGSPVTSASYPSWAAWISPAPPPPVDDRDALDQIRAVGEHERLAARDVADALGEAPRRRPARRGAPRRRSARTAPRGSRRAAARAARCCRARGGRRAPGGRQPA